MSCVCRGCLLVLVGLLSSACLVSSLQPIYDDESIVFDDGLVGTWENRESEVTVVINRGEWRSYHLAFTDRFGTTRWTGHLARAGAARLLNVRPEDGVERQAFLVATNGFMQIEVEQDRVRVREPEYAVILERTKAGKLGLDAAIDLKQNVLITSSSSKVRTWLAAALKDETLWAEWKTFARSSR
jgi:hypothetical protein